MSIIGLNVHSFDQRQHNENIKAIPDQPQNQTMQQNVMPKPQTSQPQPESTTKQPSNKQ